MEKSLRDLIARLPIPGLKESTDRHVIAKVLADELRIPIQPKQIGLKEGVLIVAVPPVVKSALHMKQQRIFELLNREGIVVRTIK